MSMQRVPSRVSALTPGDQGLEALVAAARNASPDAIAGLYERYAGQLLCMLRVMTGSTEDAEDIVHDLFLGLPEALRAYEHRGQLYPWLRAVAVRIALMRMRVTRRRDRFAGDESEATQVPVPATDPWTATDLEAAIARLPESLRVVFVLRQIEDRSHDETSAILGISPGAVRARYVRAVQHLRAFLKHGS